MNYIKEAEDILINHRKLNDSINNLNARKNYIANQGKPKELGGIDYSKPRIQRQNYSNNTITQMCEIMQINERIKETEAELVIVNNILKQIDKEDETLGKFIQLKYIEGQKKKSMRKIAAELGYSEDSNDTIYNIKNKALREFAIRYFGSIARKST